MSKKQLPSIEIQARQGISFDPPKSALAKWNPALNAKADDTTISIYDVIGYEEFGGVGAKRIAAALRSIGDRDVTVNINSPGGDMFEGIAIYNLLRLHAGKVTVRVIGLAASAASIIAMAGDEIQVSPASFVMIHNVWALAIGNRHDMREFAEFLEPFDSAIADVYAARTGNDKAAIEKMMDAETWLNGSQAIDKGFADALMPADAVEEDDDDDDDKWKDPDALARGFNSALLKGGVQRTERMSLMNALTNALKGSQQPTGSPGPSINQPGQENQIMSQQPNGGTTATPATPATPAAAAPAVPNDDAIKADRQRIQAIMTLDDAKGREPLAQHLAFAGMSVDDAKAALAAAPKASKLDAAMAAAGTPGVGQGTPPEPQAFTPEPAYAVYARRRDIFNKNTRAA